MSIAVSDRIWVWRPLLLLGLKHLLLHDTVCVRTYASVHAYMRDREMDRQRVRTEIDRENERGGGNKGETEKGRVSEA